MSIYFINVRIELIDMVIKEYFGNIYLCDRYVIYVYVNMLINLIF